MVAIVVVLVIDHYGAYTGTETIGLFVDNGIYRVSLWRIGLLAICVGLLDFVESYQLQPHLIRSPEFIARADLLKRADRCETYLLAIRCLLR